MQKGALRGQGSLTILSEGGGYPYFRGWGVCTRRSPEAEGGVGSETSLTFTSIYS